MTLHWPDHQGWRKMKWFLHPPEKVKSKHKTQLRTEQYLLHFSKWTNLCPHLISDNLYTHTKSINRLFKIIIKSELQFTWPMAHFILPVSSSITLTLCPKPQNMNNPSLLTWTTQHTQILFITNTALILCSMQMLKTPTDAQMFTLSFSFTFDKHTHTTTTTATKNWKQQQNNETSV